MKKLLLVILAGLLCGAGAMILADGDEVKGEMSGWFDMEGCGFCKELVADGPEMLEHMDWEHYPIEAGIISVTTVDDDYMDEYRACWKRMSETGKKMEAGEMVPMCNSCQAMGTLMMKGAKWESSETKHGTVSVMTSTDPKVVEEIHSWGERTTMELAQFEGHDDDDDDDDHEGHDH